MMRLLLALIVISCPMTNVLAFQVTPQAKADTENKRQRLIVLADRSGSMAKQMPPETTQAAVLHLLELAALANRNLEVLVITFGGDVKVFGGQDGKPTAAYESLARKLIAEWPKAIGATPLDLAFERTVEACSDAREVPTTVLLLSDGDAHSGWLRPEDFPEIQAALDARAKALRAQVVDEDPAFQTDFLRRHAEKLSNPESEDFKKLFAKQLPAEQAKALEHAKSLHSHSVRFVTLDFTNNERIKELHKTAGGVPADYILTTPDQVISKLQDRKVTTLSGIAQLKTLEIDANPNATEHDFVVKTDPMADGVFVAIEFHPAIPDFATECRFSMEADGQSYEFDVENPEPETVVTRDAKGSVATMSIRLPFVPQNHTLRFHWESPNGTRTVPRFSVYPFLALKKDLLSDFRPVHLPLDHMPTHRVSANHAASWRFVLRTKDNSATFGTAKAEAVFRSGERTQRISMAPSSESPGSVASKPLKLPVGMWDVDVYAETDSGIPMYLSLRKHVESVLKDEAILISLPQASDSDPLLVSDSRSHLDFGPLGDVLGKRTLEFEVMSFEFDAPVTVVLDGEIADCEGNIPVGSWVSFNRKQVTLFPGRRQKLRATLAVPDHVGKTIVDGPLEGLFRVRIADSGYELPIRRAEEVSGVPEDAPADRITAELKRPRIVAAIPWALRNWVTRKKGRGQQAIVRVDINQPFQRTVIVNVKTDSKLDRTLSVFPSPTLTDASGRSVPEMRLVPTKQTELTQTLAPGDTGTWEFIFEVDPKCATPVANAFLDIHGDGVMAEVVTVVFKRRGPLLANSLVQLGWVGFAVLTLLLLSAIFRMKGIKRLVTDAEPLLTLSRPLHGLLALESPGPGRVVLTPACAMEVSGSRGVNRFQRLTPGQSMPIRVEDLQHSPKEIRCGEGESRTVVRITGLEFDDDGNPEAEVVVMDGGHSDILAANLRKRLVWFLFLTAGCLVVANCIDHPLVILALQWLRDLIFG